METSWDAPTAKRFVSERFAASGKLWCSSDLSAANLLHPLVGYRISSIELLSSAPCAAATSALSRMWATAVQHEQDLSSEQLAVRTVFDALLRESGGASLIVYHGCSASAARSIAEHGFVKSSLRDDGYFGRGIYATPNAEYACQYATAAADWVGAVVMCRACVPTAYFVTLADYEGSSPAGHSKLYGQALKSEEAHFALVSRATNWEVCAPSRAEYCELCVSQVAALCPVAILMVEAADFTESEAPHTVAVDTIATSRTTDQEAKKSQHNVDLSEDSSRLDPSREFVLAAVQQNGCALKHASNGFQGDREIAFVAVKQNGRSLQFASEELRRDRGIVLAAVRQNGAALNYAAKEFQRDREITLAAVQQNGSALEFASEELRRDREIVLAALEQNGAALNCAAKEFQGDREIALAAVKQNGRALQFASEELRRDREIALAAVKQNDTALEYASKEFLQDRQIMIAAVKHGDALWEASGELQGDREVVLAALKENGRQLKFAASELRQDREVVLAAVKQNGTALEFAASELRKDREFVLAAVKHNGRALEYASEELRRDREVVLAAVKQDGGALKYASEELQHDREIVLAAVKHGGLELKYASDESRRDREFALAAVKLDPGALQYASKELRRDRDFLLTAVGLRGCALQFAADCLRADRGVVLAAVLQDESALQYADESLQSDQHFLREVSERRAAIQNAAIDARFTLDPSWDAPTAKRLVSERFAASGKLWRSGDPSAANLLHPLVGYRISSIELLSSASCAAATSALSRMWATAVQHEQDLSSEQLAVRTVFDELLRESGGASMIVYHGCSASAVHSIAEHGFVRSSQRDDGYFGRGIYATPNAEYACQYATAQGVGAVVMCRACVPSAYFVTLADYEGSSPGHSKLYGQALQSEEAHFALVSRATKWEACEPSRAEYCELCVSQVAALCPIAILMVEAPEATTTAGSARATRHIADAPQVVGFTR